MASERPWFESIVACVPEGLALVRRDGTVLWANRELARLAGLGDASPKGAKMKDLLPGWEAVAARAAQGRASDAIVIESPERPTRELLVTVAPCAPGLEAAHAIHVRDIGEHRELQRRLNARERSYSFLRENTSDLIVRADRDGVVTWTNEGMPAHFPLGAHLRTLLSPDSFASLAPSCSAPTANVVLRSAEGIRPAFCLAGIARHLEGEDGQPVGLSLLLRDDTESQHLAHFIAEHDLSPREEEIIRHVVQGYSNLNIATILGLSESGVKFHIRNVFARARIASRTELMARLLEG